MYLVLNLNLVTEIGIEAAAFYAYLFEKTRNEFTKLYQNDIENELGLSCKVQLRLTRILIENGLLETKMEGQPCRKYYKTLPI